MKREEKNQQMRRRIMDSALEEFSQKGYGASSINTICAAQNVSKGIVYHYFETKDALFLACVEECFERLMAYIQANMDEGPIQMESQLEKYFTVRTVFFQTFPVYQRLFCEAVLSPPAHLYDEIQQRKRDFDQFNLQTLERLLAPVSLCPGISLSEVIDMFRLFQDFINVRYQMADAGAQAFDAHEEGCRKALNILLYGVIDRKDATHE